MNRLLGSIRARLLAAAALWLTLALLAAWWVIGSVLAGFVTDRFDAEASAIADTVIAGTEIGADGGATVQRPPTDPRLSMPLSLWSWQLETASGAVIAKSASLLDLYLHAPAHDFSGGNGTGIDGEPLRVLRRSFAMPDVDERYAVIVTAPNAEIEAAVSRVRRPLAIALICLGIGLVAASVAQVAVGLRALDLMGRDLRAIRVGEADALPLPPVTELRGIAVEINELLNANRTVISRAREHLGNLAHTLKTPLAALANSIPADHPGQTFIARMDRQIGWHLRRARSAGTPRLLGQSTDVRSVVEDILFVLRRAAEDQEIAITVSCDGALRFAGERHDLEEMLGNLLENAVKYARTKIEVAASQRNGKLLISISDDGPGMALDDHARALERGGRLDEMGPAGAGLGLAIVADLAALHGGTLRLDRSEMGGLKAQLSLPA